jgi:hypothetical protein
MKSREPASGVEAGAASQGPHRAAQVRQALVLEWITAAWMIIESNVAIAAAIEARRSPRLSTDSVGESRPRLKQRANGETPRNAIPTDQKGTNSACEATAPKLGSSDYV